MSLIGYDYHMIVTADPEIDSCPAYQMSGSAKVESTGKQISLFDGEREYDRRQVAAALGPITCKLCEKGCTEAYILVGEEGLEVLRKEARIPVRETPISIRLVDEGTLGIPEPETPIETMTIAEANHASYGSRSRFYDQLVNAAIDLHRTGVLSVGPDGDFATHQESFQPELDFVAMPVAIAAREEGQLSLFS